MDRFGRTEEEEVEMVAHLRGQLPDSGGGGAGSVRETSDGLYTIFGSEEEFDVEFFRRYVCVRTPPPAQLHSGYHPSDTVCCCHIAHLSLSCFRIL